MIIQPSYCGIIIEYHNNDAKAMEVTETVKGKDVVINLKIWVLLTV